MTTLNINGRRVKVGDGFKSLSPEQQNATVEEIARSLGGGSNPAPTRNDDALSMVRTASGGVLEGIPVVGPMIRGGVERAAAATLAPFSDMNYGEILERIQQGSQAEKTANPWVDAGSKLTGAIAGTVPMVMAAPAAFGAGAGSLGARTVASTATSTGLGLADSAVRSNGDTDEMFKGGMAGFVTGALGPAVGQAIGAGVRGVRNWRAAGQAARDSGIDRTVLSRVGRAARDDGLDAASIRQRMLGLGPDAMMMDLGPNLQRQAGALAATPGRGQEVVRSAIQARDAGASNRIMGALDDTLGPTVLPSQIDDGIRANQQALSPAYQEAFRSARRVDAEPIANELESAMVNLRGPAQKAARDVRQMLNVIGTDVLDPNPQTLFQTRQAIDGRLATEADPNAIRLLTTTRQQVDEVLAKSVPGIKDVDARFAELARQRDALPRGQQVLDSGRTAPRPQELASEFYAGALPQGRQIGPSAVPLRMRQGARDEIDRIVGTNINDRVALQRLVKGEGDWNRARLSTLFGKERAGKIFDVLDRERLFAETSNVVTRNSETAARQAAMQEIGGSQAPQFGPREAFMSGGPMGAARAAGVRAAEKLAEMIMGSRNTAANSALANTLVTSRYEPVVKALEAARSGKAPNQAVIDQITRSLLLGSGQSAVRP